VIHVTLLVALQLQPAVVETANDPVDAVSFTEALAGLMVYAQGAPACVTVMLAPATVRKPTLGLVLVFAVTL
jgi:hypothetical protein